MLHVIQGPDRGKRFSLPENEPQLIGRSSEALPITDRSVSRRHAELTPDDGKWYLRDLESANGTFLNGEKIDGRIELSPGDQIRCGSSLYLFAVNPEENARSPIRVLGPEELDATVESRLNPPDHLLNDESLVLASPDPAAAAMHHLRLVYEITSLTAKTIERDELLNRVMDLIFEEFQPDRGFILLQHGASERPDPVVIRYKTRPRTRDEGHIPVSRTIVQHVIRHGEGILASNAMTDPRFRSGDSVREYGIRSAICVPIKTRDRNFGVIHIDSSVANFTYTEGQLRLLTAIGQHAALAMVTSSLIGERMRTERLAAIGETVASLSHAIKNILQGLRGGADAVQLSLNRGDLALAKEAWPILSRNLDRIFTLTQNMLAYSKQRSPELETVNLRSLVEEVVSLVQPQCDQRRIALLLDLDEAMPPFPMDANAVHQALMNLITNAIDAVPDRKGAISIKTRYDADAQRAEVMVADNGPGVNPEVAKTIYDVFSSTKGQRGTGLGLAVTRKIVREHGGEISFSSKPKEGAVFTFWLPTDLEPTDPSETKSPKPAPSDTDW